MAQTAVEWIIQQLPPGYRNNRAWDKIIKQAKQMENEQKEEEYKRGWEESKSTAIKYVEEFTNRLQNETN